MEDDLKKRRKEKKPCQNIWRWNKQKIEDDQKNGREPQKKIKTTSKKIEIKTTYKKKSVPDSS
jgi:hypothetical protein